jgi:hypothetical protein
MTAPLIIDVDEIDDIIEALQPPERTGMFLRPQPDTTLEDLIETLPAHPASWGGGSHNISVRLEDEAPVIVFGEHEVPATKTGLEAIGSYFGVPTKFLTRIERDEQQFVLERRIERAEESNLTVHWSSDGIIDVIKASSQRLEVGEILDSVAEVMPENSLVVEWINTSEMLFLDTIVPVDFDRFTGGDRKVGDITNGGLRIFQDRKRNLAPSVQPFLFRFGCTNGMQVSDSGLKIDARGAETFEILGDLRAKSRQALDGLMHSIDAFYELRSQKIGEDRTGVLHRLVRENDFPARTVVALEDALPGYLTADFGVDNADEATMFHLVNLLTNAANNPDIAGSHNSRRRLESIGGDLVNDHIARCGFCHSRLN